MVIISDLSNFILCQHERQFNFDFCNQKLLKSLDCFLYIHLVNALISLTSRICKKMYMKQKSYQRNLQKNVHSDRKVKSLTIRICKKMYTQIEKSKVLPAKFATKFILSPKKQSLLQTSTNKQSCKMSQIRQKYLCKNIEKLG